MIFKNVPLTAININHLWLCNNIEFSLLAISRIYSLSFWLANRKIFEFWILFRESFVLSEVILKVFWSNRFLCNKDFEINKYLMTNWQNFLEILCESEHLKNWLNAFMTKFSSPFPKGEDSELEIEITPLFPEEEVFAKRTFEEKLSFRQNFLTLGFSYGKGAW